MLDLVKSLLDGWHSNDIRYCHWKSNEAITRGLNGDGDLDVLVSQYDTSKAYRTLTELGFKRLTEQPNKAYPGIEHWLGLSRNEGKFVHVHLHFRLVYGEKFIKGHRYSNEHVILERRIYANDIYQISREDELIFLFIRTILKIDFIWVMKCLLGIEKHYFPDHILKEYRFLLENISIEKTQLARNSFLAPIDNQLLISTIKTVENLNLIQLLLWKRKILKVLSLSRRLSKIEHIIVFVKVYTSFLLKKARIIKKAKKQIYSGGVTLGLLGADGAGKSTMVKELNRWLSDHLEVEVLYGGTGDGKKSYMLTLFDAIHGFVQQRSVSSATTDSNTTAPNKTGNANRLKILLKNIRSILIALHRRDVVSKARLHSNNGKIVLYDRFPQPFNRDYSDGPKVLDQGGKFSKWLLRWEQEIYDSLFLCFPDFCMVLMVDPQVSISRKGEDSEKTISDKNKVLHQIMEMKQDNCVLIDANEDYQSVLLQLKEKVWERL